MDDLGKFRRQVRAAIADYMRAEGCGCCRDNDAHQLAKAELARLLRVPKYSDDSGFNFARFVRKRRSSSTKEQP